MRAAGRPRQESTQSVRSQRKPPSLSPQDFARIAASFGQAHHYHRLWHRMAALLAQHPERFLYRMSPEEITKVAWGYAQVKVQEPQLFKEIAHHARRCITGFTPHELAQLVWAFSEVRHPGTRGLMDIIARQAEARMVEFEPRDLVKLLKALGDNHELTLQFLARFLPTLAGSLHTLKTPVLLQAMGAVAAAATRHRANSQSSTEQVDLVVKFLQKAAPTVLARAQHTCTEWEQELDHGKRARDLVWLQREWQDWAGVQQLYQQFVNTEDKALVLKAVGRLEELHICAASKDLAAS